jgi:hypothetical protein
MLQQTASKRTFLQLVKALNSANQFGRRHDYAYRASNGRTESTKALTENEAKIILAELEQKFPVRDGADVMRKKIISFAHQMFWELPGGKADMKRINNWCVEKGPYQKKLNDHTVKELTILVSVFKKIYKDFMDRI